MGGDNVLLITIRTLAIRLTILAFMLTSGPWPKAPSCVEVEKPTVYVVVVVSFGLGFGGCLRVPKRARGGEMCAFCDGQCRQARGVEGERRTAR